MHACRHMHGWHLTCAATSSGDRLWVSRNVSTSPEVGSKAESQMRSAVIASRAVHTCLAHLPWVTKASHQLPATSTTKQGVQAGLACRHNKQLNLLLHLQRRTGNVTIWFCYFNVLATHWAILGLTDAGLTECVLAGSSRVSLKQQATAYRAMQTAEPRAPGSTKAQRAHSWCSASIAASVCCS